MITEFTDIFSSKNIHINYSYYEKKNAIDILVKCKVHLVINMRENILIYTVLVLLCYLIKLVFKIR